MSAANEASQLPTSAVDDSKKRSRLSWHLRWIVPVALIPLALDVAHGLLSRPQDAKLLVNGRQITSLLK